MSQVVTEKQVLHALRTVMELHRDLLTLDMVKDVQIDSGEVTFTVVLTTPASSMQKRIEDECREAVRKAGASKVTVKFTSPVTRDHRVSAMLNAPVGNTIAVASGKGGVGKSTVSVNLAISLAMEGAKVGLLDADIYGPNIPLMMGIKHLPAAVNQRIMPSEAYGVKLMSMGFLIQPDQPVMWRGPMLHQALGQFLKDVNWGELDYLIIDMPPGTGDVQISMAQTTALTAGVIVTTPQKVALSDVRKGFVTFQKLDIPVLGIIENMSYFIAPDTRQRYDIFGHGGGQRYAAEMKVPFLGELPIDPRIAEGGDTGQPIVVAAPKSPAAQAIREIARQVAAGVHVLNMNRQPEGVIGLGSMNRQPEGLIGLGDIPVMMN